MTETKTKRRWFRFSLRTLFGLVLLAAVGSWGYLVAWPLWIKGREQLDFESSVRQVRAGMRLSEWSELIHWNGKARGSTQGQDAERKPIGIAWAVWPNAMYCVFYRLSQSYPRNDSNNPITSVEVLRLPPVPNGYKAKTWRGKVFERPSMASYPEREAGCYVDDFLDFVSGDRKNNPGFQYELIYSDPPTK